MKTEKLVSAQAGQDQTFSRDAALIALAQAQDQVVGSDYRPRPDEPIDGSSRSPKMPLDAKARPPTAVLTPVTLADRSAEDMKSSWRLLVGLVALVPIAAMVLGWYFLTRRDEILVPTSSVSKELVAKVSSLGTAAASGTGQAQSTARRAVGTEREVDELKTKQDHMLLENSERDRRLEEAQELIRSNTDLMKDLKSAQSQMAQDNANLAAQLRASQEQVATLAAQLDTSQIQIAKITAQTKASQDQVARLVEQRQRPKPLSAASMPVSVSTNKPSPKPQPQQTRLQTQNPPPVPTR